MVIKRSREDNELAERTLAMANYLIFLSGATQSASVGATISSPDRVYECKTCNRQFPSFQALGGHRASHKKPKLSSGDEGADHHAMEENVRNKAKTHACSICGLKFPIGQALGGHMRRHRAALTGSNNSSTTLSLSLETSSNSNSAEESYDVTKNKSLSNDHRRVMCLDLNLTPLENGLLEFGKLAPVVF